jgi:hypothetical protein
LLTWIFPALGARYLNLSFSNDNPSLLAATLRMTSGASVYANYPALQLQPGEVVTFDQSDASNAGLAFVITDLSFSITYNCPGITKCTQADYIGLNAQRFVSTSPTTPVGTTVRAANLPGLTQTVTAPLVKTSSSYHIAGFPYNGNAITITVDTSKIAELYALTIAFPLLFIVSNEVALRFLTIQRKKE